MAAKEDFRPLDERPREILNLIIRSYITSGEPVGSRTLAKAKDEKSLPGNGWRTLPSTLPPLFFTTSEVFFSSEWPNA